MFSMEENPDYVDDSETKESEEPAEGFTSSKSAESRESVMRKRTRKTSTLSEGNVEDDNNVPETDDDNEPAEA